MVWRSNPPSSPYPEGTKVLAVANPLSVTVSGQTAHIVVSYQTAVALPQLTANLGLFENGVQRQTVQAVLPEVPAETVPHTQVGNTNVGWEIRTDQGVVRLVTQNIFDLTRT